MATKEYINSWAVTTTGGAYPPGTILTITLEDGERKIGKIDYPWYFYVDKGAEKDLEKIRLEGRIDAFKTGNNYIRVYMPKRKFRDKLVQEVLLELENKGYKTYEGDVGPAKRFMLDYDVQITDFENINIWYFDIETDDSVGGIEYETKNGFTTVKAKDRVLSIAAVDKNGKEFFYSHEDEPTLLKMFNQALVDEKVDMLSGWNSKDFDMDYLKGRMRHNRIRHGYLNNILHEDMMKRVQYFYSKDPTARQSITSYSLNSIAEYFLGEQKVEHEGMKIIDMYNDNFELFKEYNLQDCRLLLQLENKLGLIALTYHMFQMCQVTAQNWSMVKTIDNFILSSANKKGIHYPTNRQYLVPDKDERVQYLGAYVLDPPPGVYDNVYVFDFKSLYPNIIRTFNISPEIYSSKKKEGIETPGTDSNGEIKGKAWYDKKPGIIPTKIGLLLEERAAIRKKQRDVEKGSSEWNLLNVKQLVVKELANSIYGVLGNQYFRSFSIDIAESITATGQYLIKYLKEYYEKRDIQVIYGDTDSVFLSLPPGTDIPKLIQSSNDDLAAHLKKDFGVNICTIELDLDKTFSRFIIESKKKYAGIPGTDLPKRLGGIAPKISGLEAIKRDNIKPATEFQRGILDRILYNRGGLDSIRRYIKRYRNKLYNKPWSLDDISIYKRLGKHVDLYKAKKDSTKKYTAPLHVRIAKELDDNELKKGGAIIQYIITGTGPLEGVHVSNFDDKWDRDYYWQTLIYPGAYRLLKTAYPEEDWDQFI